MKLHYYFTLILLSLTLITSCNKDDIEKDDGQNIEYPASYVQAHIIGPTHNSNNIYNDSSDEDEFITLGRLYTKDENPDLSEDQIQLNIRKSYTESNFLLVMPPEIGTHTITYQDGASDFDVRVILSPGEDYYAKSVTVSITALEMDGNTVSHCEGTFVGPFYRNNLDESDVHQINGAFEINQ